MMKVRILDRCEYCDGELSMREARRLTAIDHARCVMAVEIGRYIMNPVYRMVIRDSTMLLNFRHSIGQRGSDD